MKPLVEFKVSDCMTRQATVIQESAKLTDAIRLMESERLSMLPVVNPNLELVGVLSKTDLVKKTREIQSDISALHTVDFETQEFLIQLLAEEGNTAVVQESMNSPAQTIRANATMVDAARKMLQLEFHHLPVVDDSGKPIGVLSTTDFVKAFANEV